MENKNLHEKMAELLNGLTDEQKEKAMACKTMEELTAFLGELGAVLPDEALDAIAGGTEQIWMFFPKVEKPGSDKQKPQPKSNIF